MSSVESVAVLASELRALAVDLDADSRTAADMRAAADALEGLAAVLVFADGLCVSQLGHGLADLYNDTTPLQRWLTMAGCWPRGSFNDRR